MSEEWSTDRKFQQFKTEVEARFVREREFWRDIFERETADARSKNPNFDAQCKAWGIGVEFDPSLDCLEWNLFEHSEILLEDGMVKIILDSRYALRPEWCHMFEMTSVAWSGLLMSAQIRNGEPRIVLDMMMIDYWDDEREAEWHKNHIWEPDHKYDLEYFVSKAESK